MIRLVYIERKYVRYLQKFDKNIMFNKGGARPYIGIVFEVKNFKYYAPLTHPKEKFKTMKNSEDFMKIKNGELGAINFNNMIPVVESAIIHLNVSEVLDNKYKMLLINQIRFLNQYETTILNKGTKLYMKYKQKN